MIRLRGDSSEQIVRANSLAGIYETQGLQVVFDIMEDICNAAENDFIGESPANREVVLAKHAIMHAQRAFFQQVTESIDFHVSEAREGEDRKLAQNRSNSTK